MRKYIPLFILAFITLVASAQNRRPKIGLVLSGGGAKGIAHIGILKAMEEAGLTPDYITGTSMGSIVGGLYAAGYSADELAEILENVDWDLLLTNKIPLDKVTFEEKFYYGRYLLDFYLEGKQLQLPRGIIEGQALIELFSTLTRQVHGVEHFSDLPIPFACVATNIVTGEPVVLNSGSLAMSMRASMAIPSIFTPVKINDRLLVDGGLVRNMPVTEVLDMGADIVIGVFVSSDLEPEEKLTSAVSILSQSAFITSAFDSREQMEKCDLLIIPDLDGYSTGSFSSASAILARGMEAGKAYEETFRELADSLIQLGPLHKVVKPQVPDDYVFDEIRISGNKIIQAEFITGKLMITPGLPVSIDYLENRLDVIYGTQYFESIWYEILEEDGIRILKINVNERPRIQFRFSYHYDSENKGGVVGNITLRNLLLNRSRLIFEADLATHPAFLMDYFKYLGKRQSIAFGATGIFSKNELPAYDSAGNISLIFSSNYKSGGIKIQTTRNQNSTVGIEARWSNLLLKPKIAGNDFQSITKIQYNNTTFTAFYRHNSFNDRYFPTRGINADIEISTSPQINGKVVIGDTLTLREDQLGDLLQTDNISSLNISIFPVISLTPELSLLLKSRLRLSTIGAETLNLNEYDFVGGFIPPLYNSNEFYGAGQKEYILANYFFGRLGIQYTIKNKLFLQADFNYLDSKNLVNWVYPDADTGMLGDRTWRIGYGAQIGYKSPVGPIIFHVAKDQHRKEWKTALVIGFYY